MTLEVEERPRLAIAGYGRHRSQWLEIVGVGRRSGQLVLLLQLSTIS